MRRLHPIFRLIASLFFGIAVLSFFVLVSAEMADHFFEGVAERSIRQAFAEQSPTRNGARYVAVCRSSDSEREGSLECDPFVIKAERSLRSSSCSGRGLLRLVGRNWSCVARFTDGATLNVDVSLGFGRPHLEIVLPIREPETG